MSDKPRKTAGDLKLIIEEKLRAGHPEFERAEVVIIPPVADQPWAASLFGTGPTIDQECRKRIDSIVAQLPEQFDWLKRRVLWPWLLCPLPGLARKRRSEL